MFYENENEAAIEILCGHMRGMAHRLRKLRPEHRDFTFAPAAPTPRILATHAWQWLVCDRQHIREGDASKHPLVPEAPEDFGALCDALAAEADNWEELLKSLTPEDMAREGKQFNIPEAKMNVRGFVAHMVQNAIYKHGQFATMYFALGYDGEEPYSAPFPNPIYEEVFGARDK